MNQPPGAYSMPQLQAHKLQSHHQEDSKQTRPKRGIRNPLPTCKPPLLSDKKTLPKRIHTSTPPAILNNHTLFQQLLDNQHNHKQAKTVEQDQPSLQAIMEESTRGTYHEQKPIRHQQHIIVQPVSELSKETEDIVNSLLGAQQTPIQPQSTLDHKIQQIQSGVTMREKYGDLTKDQLPLPYIYARLAKCQELADNMLVTFCNRGKARFFSNLSDSLEESCRTHMKTQQLRQCMAIQPGLYDLTYERNHERGGFYDLYITLPHNTHPSLRAMLKHRKDSFREQLINRTKQFHQQYLLSIKHTIPYDYSLNTWHPGFDVHSIQDLPMAELPKKPVQIKDFMNKVRHEAEEVQTGEGDKPGLDRLIEERTNRKSLSERTQEFMKKYSNMKKEAAKGLEVFDTKTGLSLELTRRIQEKEARLKQEREEKGGEVGREWKGKKKELKGVAELVNHTFLKRGVSNMFYVTLVEVLWETKHSMVLSKDDLVHLLDTLKDHFHHWLKYIPNKSGRIVRIDRTHDLSQLLRDIDAL